MLDENDIYLEQDFEVQFFINECIVPENVDDDADYMFHLLVNLPNEQRLYMKCTCRVAILRQAKIHEVPGDIARAVVYGFISAEDESMLFAESLKNVMTVELSLSQPPSEPEPAPTLVNQFKRTLEYALEISDQNNAREFKRLRQSIHEARRMISDVYFEDFRPDPNILLDDFMDDTMDIDDTEEVLGELVDDHSDSEGSFDDCTDDATDSDDVEEVLHELQNLQ